MIVSLWLIPESKKGEIISSQIASLAATEISSSGPFPPHITLVGGLDGPPDQIDEWKNRLANFFQVDRFGPVYCDMETTPHFALDEDNRPIWHQSAVFLLKMDTDHGRYLELRKKCLQVLEMPIDTPFAPPLCHPHLSMYYGERNVPQELQPIPSFWADSVALWTTEPNGIEGVPHWKRLALFSL